MTVGLPWALALALRPLHAALEPQRARFEMRLALRPRAAPRIGDGRPELGANVIRIDFVRKRRC